MSIKEYQAGMQLEALALDLQQNMGAIAFHSLIHAALRQAESDNLTILARTFPVIRKELMLFRDSAAYVDRDSEILEVAKLMARVRQLLGQGLVLYEMSQEIANATGGNIDQIQPTLSHYYNEIVKAYEG